MPPTLPSPIGKSQSGPASQSASTEDRMLAHLAHIDRIVTAFYRLTMFSVALGLIGGILACAGALLKAAP